MKTIYACTHVMKHATEDSSEHGCDPYTSRMIMAEEVNVQAKDLPSLIKSVGERYGLDIDDVCLCDADDDGAVPGFSFNRLETGDACDPTPAELDKWKNGDLTLYLCDYDFDIEKRQTSGVPIEEFAALAAASIKSH